MTLLFRVKGMCVTVTFDIGCGKGLRPYEFGNFMTATGAYLLEGLRVMRGSVQEGCSSMLRPRFSDARNLIGT